MKFLEILNKTTWLIYKCVSYLFLLLVVLNITSSFLISGCKGGSFGYDECLFNGIDVSYEYTYLSWITILWFALWCATGLVAVLFRKITALKI